MAKEVKFSLVFRDMWQSAGKYQPRVDQLVKVAPKIIEMGCWDRVETNGGGFEQVNLLYGENPNRSVREWTKPFHEAGIQTHMLDRALNALRMFPCSKDLRKLFYVVKKKQGTDITRIFCGLNDPRNVIPSIGYAKEAGMIAQAALCITFSPIHTVEYYVNLAKKFIEAGADEICLKDMAGIGRPDSLGKIVAGIKAYKKDIIIQYHSHAGPGFNTASILEVCKAGCDYIDCGMSPLSWGTGHADVITVQEMLKDLLGDTLQGMLEAEMDEKLGYSKYDYKNKDTDNSRNGHSHKNLRTSFGDVEISVPRDRKGEFEPQLVKKNQTSISQDIEDKIVSMYAKGMSTSDIESHIQDIYGLSVSDTTISRITDKVLPLAREWQQRPLESLYAVVFMDAIHYHVRSEGQIVKKAVYIAIGINLEGHKDVLGMWVGENESAKFWAGVLNSMRNRGVEDILIACTDNLTGFSAAIEAVFPKTEIQNCIIHQLRNSSKYVSYKDLKELMADLKEVYAAPDEGSATAALERFSDRWDKKYPKISQSWRDNWANLSTYFKYPPELRRLIYTTNTIEGFNRQLRKVTKSKSVFPTDDSLLKMLYLAMMDITKKWTGRRQDWSIIHAQLAVYFEDRLPE